MSDVKHVDVKLYKVVLSYPELFQAKAFEPGQEEKYGAQFLMKKNDPQAKALLEAVAAVKKFCSGKGEYKNYAVRDGDTMGKPETVGCWVIAAKAPKKRKPFVVGRDAKAIMDESEIYGGCIVNARLSFYVPGAKYTNTICGGLDGVQKVKDGTPFGGQAVNTFDEVPETAEETAIDAEGIL